jgi:hypothetical protein
MKLSMKQRQIEAIVFFIFVFPSFLLRGPVRGGLLSIEPGFPFPPSATDKYTTGYFRSRIFRIKVIYLTPPTLTVVFEGVSEDYPRILLELEKRFSTEET